MPSFLTDANIDHLLMLLTVLYHTERDNAQIPLLYPALQALPVTTKPHTSVAAITTTSPLALLSTTTPLP